MAQTSYIGEGTLHKITDIVRELGVHKVLLVTGGQSYAASGAKAYLDEALKDVEVRMYSDFHGVLEDEDVQKGIVVQNEFKPDIVVAVGGGHVMDAGKAINYYSTRVPVVAVPTTAGSGAETTPFAVIYKNGIKTSLEGPEVLPAYAIVDPALNNAPRLVMLSAGLDALCQAIESYWAKGGTDESREFAQEALKLGWSALEKALMGDKEALADMSHAAHLAGKAIAISKTTACHALSYGLTYKFGVPHGLAVALTMPSMMRFNSVALPQGITPEAFEDLLKKVEAPTLRTFGVTEADIPSLAGEVDPERLGNNPKALTKEDIIAIYTSVI